MVTRTEIHPARKNRGEQGDDGHGMWKLLLAAIMILVAIVASMELFGSREGISTHTPPAVEVDS